MVNEFVQVSPAEPCMFCLSNLKEFSKRERSGRTVTVLWGGGYFQDLFPSGFSRCVLFASMWCIHGAALPQPQLLYQWNLKQRNFEEILFYSIREIRFPPNRKPVNSSPRVSYVMLASLSVDEILLLKSVNLSINFRGLSLKMEMALFRLKYMNSVLFAFS